MISIRFTHLTVLLRKMTLQVATAGLREGLLGCGFVFTHLPPLPDPIMSLKQSLIVGYTVLPFDKSKCGLSISESSRIRNDTS